MALSRVVSLESLVSKITYNALMGTLNPTNSLTRIVSEILNVENAVTLTWGQRSLKVIESGIIR